MVSSIVSTVELPLLGDRTPRIAVLLAAYNGMAFLPAQCASILAQRDVDVRVFVSVDPSTDDTLDWLERQAMAEPRMRVLPTEERFGGAAPNFLRLLRDVDLHDFDAVSFADQDDLWPEDKLTVAWNQLCQRGVSGYSCNVEAFWPDGRRAIVDKAQPQRRWDHLFEAAGPGCTYLLAQPFALVLQRVVREQRELLGSLQYHDWLTYAAARSLAGGWFIDPQPHMAYRQHGNNQIGVNAGWASLSRRLRQVWSGHALSQATIVARATGMWEAPFVRQALRRGRWGLIWLAANAPQCRRRVRDRWAFAALCLLMACRHPSCWESA